MLSAVPRWLRRQVADTAADPALRLYGVALAWGNLVTFAHWRFVQHLPVLLRPSADAICWPFWERCGDWRVLSTADWSLLLWTYLAISLACGAAFLRKRTVPLAMGLLAAATLLRFGIVFQDFTLRLNQHYMLGWVTLAFLLLPARRRLLPALLVAFYFWAGALKLDPEWLSGAALYNRDRIWIPEALLPASCVYVVVLEMLLVFGIRSRRGWIFWSVFAQLLLFHLVSWPVVGFYYPLLMFGLLAIFPLERLLPEQAATDARGTSGRVATGLLIGGFSLLQALPWLFPGDSAITGEGRLFALHMFDARVLCEGTMTLHLADGREREKRISQASFARRIACDPVLWFDLAKNECRRLATAPHSATAVVPDFDLRLRSRRSTQPEWQPVIDLPHFCSSDVHYDLWRPNPWILR